MPGIEHRLLGFRSVAWSLNWRRRRDSVVDVVAEGIFRVSVSDMDTVTCQAVKEVGVKIAVFWEVR